MIKQYLALLMYNLFVKRKRYMNILINQLCLLFGIYNTLILDVISR